MTRHIDLLRFVWLLYPTVYAGFFTVMLAVVADALPLLHIGRWIDFFAFPFTLWFPLWLEEVATVADGAFGRPIADGALAAFAFAVFWAAGFCQVLVLEVCRASITKARSPSDGKPWSVGQRGIRLFAPRRVDVIVIAAATMILGLTASICDLLLRGQDLWAQVGPLARVRDVIGWPLLTPNPDQIVSYWLHFHVPATQPIVDSVVLCAYLLVAFGKVLVVFVVVRCVIHVAHGFRKTSGGGGEGGVRSHVVDS